MDDDEIEPRDGEYYWVRYHDQGLAHIALYTGGEFYAPGGDRSHKPIEVVAHIPRPG